MHNTSYGRNTPSCARKSLMLLGWLSFLESTVFFIPPDPLLLAIVWKRKALWKKAALLATCTSVLGGMVGYGLGRVGWENLAVPLLRFLGAPLMESGGTYDLLLPSYLNTWISPLQGSSLFQIYQHLGPGAVFLFAISPLPYKLIALTSGAALIPLPTFIVASILGRGLRFFAVAYLSSALPQQRWRWQRGPRQPCPDAATTATFYARARTTLGYSLLGASLLWLAWLGWQTLA